MEDPGFLGQGWAFPPAFIKGSPNVVALSKAEVNIKESLTILFCTQIGERLMEFGYGTKLKSLAFGKIDAVLISSIEDTVKRGILLNEPRVSVEDIEIDLSKSREGIVQVLVEYQVIQTNERSNFVYPFHLTEGTNINL